MPATVTISVKTVNVKFITALAASGNWQLVGKSDTIGPWEKFEVTTLANGNVALKTVHGKYVSAQPDGSVIADRVAVGDWETWELIDLGKPSAAIKSFHGKYLSAQPESQNWLIVADRDQLGAWEKFQLIT